MSPKLLLAFFSSFSSLSSSLSSSSNQLHCAVFIGSCFTVANLKRIFYAIKAFTLSNQFIQFISLLPFFHFASSSFSFLDFFVLFLIYLLCYMFSLSYFLFMDIFNEKMSASRKKGEEIFVVLCLILANEDNEQSFGQLLSRHQFLSTSLSHAVAN